MKILLPGLNIIREYARHYKVPDSDISYISRGYNVETKSLVSKYKTLALVPRPIGISHGPEQREEFVRSLQGGKKSLVHIRVNPYSSYPWTLGYLACLTRSAVFFGWQGIIFETIAREEEEEEVGEGVEEEVVIKDEGNEIPKIIDPLSVEFVRKSMGASLYIKSLAIVGGVGGRGEEGFIDELEPLLIETEKLSWLDANQLLASPSRILIGKKVVYLGKGGRAEGGKNLVF